MESIAREIKLTGRSFPLFQIAQLILDRSERYSFDLTVKKGPEGNHWGDHMKHDWWHGRKETKEKGYTTHLINKYALECVAKRVRDTSTVLRRPPLVAWDKAARCGASPSHHS